jgi:large subunit ribosomal protein L35
MRAKPKTHKGLSKRVRITKTGKVKRGQPGRRHLMATKSGNKRRHLHSKVVMEGARATAIRDLIRK